MKRRSLLLVVLLLVLAVIGGVIVYSQLTSFQQLTINFPQSADGLRVALYRTAPAEPEISPDNQISKGQFIQDITQTTTLKLKKGSYGYKTTSNNDYQVQEDIVKLGDSPLTVTISPKLTDAKLASLLANQKVALHQLILQTYPATKGYTIDDGKLYGNGEWYGTTIRPILTAEQQRTTYVDIYRLVAHKVNGSWQLATKPELILNKITYPDVPQDILSDVNKL